MNVEGIVIDSVRRVHSEMGGEWDDLYQQGYLIAMEFIDGYDVSYGASIQTYLHHKVYGGLRDYVRRTLLKEETQNGRRVRLDEEALDRVYLNASSLDEQVIAKLTIGEILASCSKADRGLLYLMLDGCTQAEVAAHLGISRQAVSKRLKKIRRNNGEAQD